MNLSLGIVGLPNVGKSTLFNALTKQSVKAENYPFSTIDPNVGVVSVVDKRLYKIAEISKPLKTTPAIVEFVDIAGLVKGAASGEGLGNKFLSNIKEVSAIIHVVRAFVNSNITHVENSINTKRDIELINTELILRDIETIQNRINAIKKNIRFIKEVAEEVKYLELLNSKLNQGILAIDVEKSTIEHLDQMRKSLFLLTDKPVIYLINVDDDNAEIAKKEIQEIVKDKAIITMDIKIEAELSEMEELDRQEFMKELNLKETGLNLLTLEAYKLLGLVSFFTEGPEEVKAWTIKKNSSAPEAAATIHTDFQKKFIAADICSYNDFIQAGSWNESKNLGKVRLEGKTYIVQDGDIIIFKHG